MGLRSRLAILVALMAVGGPLQAADDSLHLPDGYWDRPLAPQGEAPASWSDVERSLAPEDCGVCHPDKLEEWQASLHARAFSPGLVGQLLSYTAGETQACLDCHAPLAEQAAAFETARKKGKAHLSSAAGLAAAGNSCSGCHLRGHRVFGPPGRDTGALGQGAEDMPHGGVFRTRDFESSEFCGACHQFGQDQAINGKPLENTVEEWRQSPQAAAGKTCQGCHMPDRKHLWRGVHDAEMVASGVTPRFENGPDGVRFTLTNTATGHAFPTYVTPKAEMRSVALDEAGNAIPGTEVVHVIQRRVVYEGDDWREISDTRLPPGASAVLAVPWGGARRMRLWLEVHPDDFYDHEVYDALLKSLPKDAAAAKLLAQADTRAQASRYRLFETTLERP